VSGAIIVAIGTAVGTSTAIGYITDATTPEAPEELIAIDELAGTIAGITSLQGAHGREAILSGTVGESTELLGSVKL
jgi:hypothetical protein